MPNQSFQLTQQQDLCSPRSSCANSPMTLWESDDYLIVLTKAKFMAI